MWRIRVAIVLTLALPIAAATGADRLEVQQDADRITIVSPEIEAAIRTQGYVSGIAAGSFLDKRTGFRDAGFGLDIVDWILEPGSDEAYRNRLDRELIYQFNNPYHGKSAKRAVEGPQICTQAKQVSPEIIRGRDFIAVRTSYSYSTAAPGKHTGSTWTQTVVFPEGKRYFISSDRIDSKNRSDAMFLRIDLPGHIRHTKGDSFSEIYLSYLEGTRPDAEGERTIPACEFFEDFAPDEKFNYRRDQISELPRRFIRAYRLRDPKTGRAGPWLAGMTLNPSVVYEAWCHQRGYVCMIEEIGGRPIEPGESFSAAYIIGFFDSIQQMHEVYDQHLGFLGLTVSEAGWKLTR